MSLGALMFDLVIFLIYFFLQMFFHIFGYWKKMSISIYSKHYQLNVYKSVGGGKSGEITPKEVYNNNWLLFFLYLL